MKVANSYASLLRGVSQQVPHERADGQHTEQINMWSDPVNGLPRRHGTQWKAEVSVTGVSSSDFSAAIADTASWVSHDWVVDGREYVLLVRRAARVGLTNLPPVFAYNKTDNQFLSVIRNTVDAGLDTMAANGVAAIASVGAYTFMAVNAHPVTGTSLPVWGTTLNRSAVVWIRGGAFDRTFTVKATTSTGTVYSVSYTTPKSSYQGTLNTSDIPASASDYQKQVNDRVNAYNTAVTQWIGTATAAIQPQAIATELRTLLVAAGISGAYINVRGGHVCIEPYADIRSLEVTDGGDGTLARGVGLEVDSVDKLSLYHFNGMVVKVRPAANTEAFYMKAVPKDPSALPGAVAEVTWVEAAGVQHAITGGLMYARVSGGHLYLASSAGLLTTILPGSHPTFAVSAAGDNDTMPMPFFVGKQVTYLGVFQNRLLVGCGSVLAVSKTDDYLNFFRSTVLTLPGDDAFEMLPAGSGGDTLRSSVMYDRDLVIFGDKRQYVVSGSAKLTATAANMAVLSNYVGCADAPPVGAGGFIMYARRGEGTSSVHQIQPGLVANSPESFPASSQLADYIRGGVVELLSVQGSPSTLLVRCNDARGTVYAFTYLDKQDGRKMDSWSSIKFNDALGAVIGMSSVPDGILLFFLRTSPTGRVYVCCDLMSLSTGTSSKPYLDSHRPFSQLSPTASLDATGGSAWACAFDHTSSHRLTGAPLPDVADLIEAYPAEPGLTVGATYDSSVTLTNPFMRDGKGKAILSGRLTVTQMIVSFRESAGFTWVLSHRTLAPEAGSFNGRVLGDPDNIIGIEPISTGEKGVPIGRETRDYGLTLAARKWYPLTVTALEWSGQFFNRVQRF